jgi:peptide/nickel transport system ATP-binding protein
MASSLLEVEGLEKHFNRKSTIDTILRRDVTPVRAVDGVSFELESNQVVGFIGESGCGKTTLLRTLMGLYDPTGGDMRYNGDSVLEFSKRDWRSFRQDVQIVFQDPFNALDPMLPVKETVKEPLRIHGMDDRDARVEQSLERVGLRPAESYLDRYPRQLSGGEKQRVSIARALVMDPEIILADEPVSMLDVSTQAEILNLLSELVDESGMSMVYISHDLSTVSYVCDRVNVMYRGRVVENGRTELLLDDPKHPYTQALINAIPFPDPTVDRERTQLEGTAEDVEEIDAGCRFRDRCPERMDICEITPEFRTVESEDQPADDRKVACHLYYDHRADSDEPVEGGVDR